MDPINLYTFVHLQSMHLHDLWSDFSNDGWLYDFLGRTYIAELLPQIQKRKYALSNSLQAIYSKIVPKSNKKTRFV